MEEPNLYEDLLESVNNEFGDGMSRYVPPLSEVESIVEMTYFREEVALSANLVLMIAKNIDANFPGKVTKRHIQEIIEEVGFKEFGDIDAVIENVDNYFAHFCDELHPCSSRRAPDSLYFLICAFSHRFALYSMDPMEEKGKYLAARMKGVLVSIEKGLVKESIVRHPEKFLKRLHKKDPKRFAAVNERCMDPEGNVDLMGIFPVFKETFGVAPLLCLQNGEIPSSVLEDMFAHLSVVIGTQNDKRRALEEKISSGEPIVIDLSGNQERVVEKETREEQKKKKKGGCKGKFNLLGRRELNKFFNEKVIDIVKNEKVYEKFGVGFPEPFILEGPPGCGKTFAVDRLAEYLDWNIYHITSSSIGSTLIHETAKKTEEIFKKAAKTSPSLVVVDEMDAFMPDRGNTRHSDSHVIEEVSSFLKCIQTASEKKVLVVGMTNFIKNIDPAILRSGRMGTHITLKMPSDEEIREVIAAELKKRPCGKIDLDKFIPRLKERPLSDVVCVVREASMNAARRRADELTEDDMERGMEAMMQNDEEKRTMGFNI